MNDDSLSHQLLKIIIVDRQNDLEKIYPIERGSLALLALHQKSIFQIHAIFFILKKLSPHFLCRKNRFALQAGARGMTKGADSILK